MSEIVILSTNARLVQKMEDECQQLQLPKPLVLHVLSELNLFFLQKRKISSLVLDHRELTDVNVLEVLKPMFGAGVPILLLSVESLRFHPEVKYHKSEASLLEHFRHCLRHRVGELKGFTAIPLAILSLFEVLPFDLFSKSSSSCYVRRMGAMDLITDEILIGLKASGEGQLYFERRHYELFSELLFGYRNGHSQTKGIGSEP